MVERITLDEFQARLRAQGVSTREHLACVCPVCGTVQSGASLIRAGAGATFDDVMKYLGFSCVGRWTEAGPHKTGAPPGRGCDWTLGGLLRLHELEVDDGEGNARMSFAVATPDQARALEAQLAPFRACRACGCTDARACPGGCHWVEPDLCSACQAKGTAS